MTKGKSHGQARRVPLLGGHPPASFYDPGYVPPTVQSSRSMYPQGHYSPGAYNQTRRVPLPAGHPPPGFCDPGPYPQNQNTQSQYNANQYAQSQSYHSQYNAGQYTRSPTTQHQSAPGHGVDPSQVARAHAGVDSRVNGIFAGGLRPLMSQRSLDEMQSNLDQRHAVAQSIWDAHWSASNNNSNSNNNGNRR